MRIRCTIEPLESRRLLAATYYVSDTGSDSNDGKSTAKPWRSIAKVNGHDFAPGDKVLFQGGKTFSVSGSIGPELLANAGFESSLNSWSDTMGTSGALATSATESKHAGSRSIKISGAGDGARAQDVTSKLKKNQTYKLGVWTRSVSASSGDRRVGVSFYKSGQAVATYYRGFRASNWAKTEFEFVSPASFDKAKIWISRKGDTSTFYADDLSLKSMANGLIFDESDSGLAPSRFIIGSYGAGKAIINAKDSIGLWAGNVSNMSVQNLIFTGTWNASTGTGANAGVGVEFANTRSNNTKLQNISIEKVEAKNFRWDGIRIGGWNGKSGFKNVAITDTLAHHNGDNGVYVLGQHNKTSTLYAHENVVIARCKAYENAGIPHKGGNSGSGIQINDTLIGTIERCVAYENGKLNNMPTEGPVGIWAFDSSKIKIQYNESHHNHTASPKDGAGFDLDGGVTNSLIQYNYSHDNDGAGYLLFSGTWFRPWGKNIVRYNISQSDGRKNGYGGITLTGGNGPANAVIEHNTIYTKPATSGFPSGIAVKVAQAGVMIRNNIIITTGGVPVVDIENAGKPAQFAGNVYWTGSSSLKFHWGSSTYTTLSSFRTSTGRETTGGKNTDPKLNSPGNAPTLNDANKLLTLWHYKPKSGSPVLNAAVATTVFAGYTSATSDFFARALPATSRDIGAAEGV